MKLAITALLGLLMCGSCRSIIYEQGYLVANGDTSQ